MRILKTFFLILSLVILSVMPHVQAAATDRIPVILDTDMTDWFDDGTAMVMLAKSPKIELLGVTIVIGNTWPEEGTASAIRHLG